MNESKRGMREFCLEKLKKIENLQKSFEKKICVYLL